MVGCAVKLCIKRSNTSSLVKDGVTFHLFPKSPRRKEKWLDAINQAGQWFPTKLSTVCSEHFSNDSFNIRKNNRRRLTDTAVPTLKLPCFGQSSNLISSEVSLEKKTLFTSSMDIEHQTSLLNTLLEKKMYMDIRRLSIGIRERNLKIKRLSNEKRSFRKKIAKLETLLKTLMEKSLITEEDSAILESIGGECTDLIRRHVKKNQKGSKYSPALRSFALTLYYYSAKAYTFVRKTFNTCLPHPRTLNKWYQCIGGEAGFTKEAFHAIRLKAKYSNTKLACTLVIDEMAIQRKIEWIPESKRYYGYVDMGTGIDNDCLDSAKEALVFLLVAINGNWKVPVAYFLVNGVSGDQRASLVTKCVEMSHVAGVTIAALTFDGCPSNLAMAKKLGCSFDPHNLKPYFIHPYTCTEIAVFLDPCHMLKLVRNAFEAYGTFIDYTGNSVERRFLKQLNDIQEQEQFNMANKLRRHHIDFKNKIMKVKLASQLFSRSVAVALQFCHIQLNLEQFCKSTPTSTFISLINDLFDILNSRTRQWGLKRALNNENKDKIFTVLDHAVFYMKHMKALVKTGKTGYKTVNILESGGKTGLIGFIVCAESTKNLYKNLTDGEFVTYLPTYKISQDHIELLFCNVRSHGGNNNNPTARQFKSIYKKILVHTQLSVSDRGNCVPLEEICILTSQSAVDRINATTGSCRYEDTTPDISALSLEDIEDIISLSKFSDSFIEYISGFVVRLLQKTIKCEKCIAALVAPASSDSLISKKDRGGLTYASPEVINICRKCELYLKGAMLESDGKHLKPKYTTDFMISKVLRSLIGTNLFNVLQIHQFDTDPLTNHRVELAKAVMEKA